LTIGGADLDFAAQNTANITIGHWNTNGTATTRMTINTAGNVGIGTTDPYQPLTIRGQNERILLDINNDTTDTYSSIAWNASSVNLGSNAYSAEIRGYRVAPGAHGALTFHTRDGSNLSNERVRINRFGRMLIGTSGELSGASGTGWLQIAGTASVQSQIARFSNDVSTCVIALHKSRGTTINTHVVVGSNDQLGVIDFRGSDGTTFNSAGSIQVKVDGAPGLDSIPGRIVFSTTAVGNLAPTETFRITSERVIAYNQPNPISKSAAATLTIAELKAGIIQYTGAAATLTLPTGTLTQGGFADSYVNLAFDWSVINTGSGTCTIGAATGHTIVGSNTVTAGSSARFASRRTGTNIIVSYRLS